MLTVPGLRPEKVMKLYKELGITSLAALEEAAKADCLKGVKGLGNALQAKILQGIAIGRESEGRRHMHRAAVLLESAEQRLRQSHPDLKRITPAGELRRGCEQVADISMKGGDVAILPAGTGHQCLGASDDFLVIGAYPPNGTYDECTKSEDRKAALKTIPKVGRPRKDPVFGSDGPLLKLWRPAH
jgi:hypothetical protein